VTTVEDEDKAELATATGTSLPAQQRRRVFISYSHDSEAHRDAVLKLAQRLRRDGVDAWLDCYEDSPAEGWIRWMERELRVADLVLLVCTTTYCRRFNGEEAAGGLGVNFEGSTMLKLIYADGQRNEKFVPVLFEEAKEAIPLQLIDATSYRLPNDYDVLYRRITNQRHVLPEALGAIRQLPLRSANESLGTMSMECTSGPPTMRPVIQARLDAAHRFVQRIRQEAQHLTGGVDEALESIGQYMDQHGGVEFDETLVRLLRDVGRLAKIFDEVDEASWTVLTRITKVRSIDVRGYTSRLSSPYIGERDDYTVQRAGRVLRATKAFCAARSDLFSDRLAEPKRQPEVPSNTTTICSWYDSSGIRLGALSSRDEFCELGHYCARSARLYAPQFRVTQGAGSRLYAFDDTTVYRWNLEERQPEAEWLAPDNPVLPDLSHLMVGKGPVEFCLRNHKDLLLKESTFAGLRVPSIPHSCNDERFVVGPDGRPDWLFQIEVDDRSTPTELVYEMHKLGGYAAPVRKTLHLAEAINEGIAALRKKDDAIKFDYLLSATPAHYQGGECFLLACMLAPGGGAMFFVDSVAGLSLRAPTLSPWEAIGPTILSRGQQEYLVCHETSRFPGRAAVFVFDISNRRNSGTCLPIACLGPRSQTSKLFRSGERCFLASELDEPSDGKSFELGIIDWNDGCLEYRFVACTSGLVLDVAAVDAP
jgi:SEFIR domain